MEGGIFMNKSEQIEYQILEDFRSGRKSRKQAALLLGISERSVTRRTKKIRERGVNGIKHGNFSKTPKNKTPEEIKQAAIKIYQQKYYDFNTAHAYELMVKNHQLPVSYVSLLNWLKESGHTKKRKRRRPSKARIYRERMANEGILLQMDGSRHKWNGKDEWSLISVIDDASSHIPAGQFYDSESTWSCMELLRRVFSERGIPQFLYTDGAGWAGGGGKRQNFSQVVRACEELGIKIIRAHSAQAKGRIERSYRTIQDRLIPEMRLKGVSTMKDANRYLDHVFWPEWNNRFTVEPKDHIDRYRPLQSYEDLEQILCMKFERIVRADHTISFDSEVYKLDPGSLGKLYKKTVMVHQYRDLTIAIYYSGKKIEHTLIKLPKRRWR